MPMCILTFNAFASSSFTIVTANIDVSWAYSYKISMFIDVTSMFPHMSYYCHTLSIYAKSIGFSIHINFRELFQFLLFILSSTHLVRCVPQSADH